MKTEQTPKHTPGPWTAIKEYDGWAIIKKDGGWGRVYIANEICQGETDGEADAKLIASAPIIKALNNELLEALEPLNKLADQCLDNSTLDKDQVVYAYNRAQITMSDLRKVRALISKCKDL